MPEPIATSPPTTPPPTAFPPTASPPQLDYGLSAPRRARRIRRFVFLLLAIALGFAGWKWGPEIARQAPILFWQRQCMRYTAPPERVVYEEDPDEATRLLADPRGLYVRYPLYRGLLSNPTPVKSSAAAEAFPRCWARLSALTAAKPSPAGMTRLGTGSGAILFLHERISSRGNRRLVCVRYFAETYSFTAQFINGYNCDLQVSVPATWTNPPATPALPLALNVQSSFPRHPPRLRIYAGQVDPDNDSRFTIRYEAWGKSDTLVGVLADDDTIALTPTQRPREE